MRSFFVSEKCLRWEPCLFYTISMKKLLLICVLLSSGVRAAVMASNVVADVCAYTGQVVTVQGVIDSVKRDSLSSSSYVVVMQGLNVRLFWDPNQMILNKKTFKMQRATYDLIYKPSVGSRMSYHGLIKKELGKPFLITEK